MIAVVLLTTLFVWSSMCLDSHATKTRPHAPPPADAHVASSMASSTTAEEFVTIMNASLTYRGLPLFLSGANQAWNNYGKDFGNTPTKRSKCELQSYVSRLSAAGGNCMRIWLFTEGASIPNFDAHGKVTALDATGTLIADLREYLQYAAHANVFVIISLWNGAVMTQNATKALFSDMEKLQSFFDNALTPLVSQLATEPALAAWEIMNEPEGSVAIAPDSEPCFDTTVLEGSGAGWSGAALPMRDILRFTNLHAAVIHAADSKALVMTAAWSEFSFTDKVLTKGRQFFNYYKDECLVLAGGNAAGTLDVHQIHTYANDGSFSKSSPFNVPATAYGLSGPIIIGEFSASKVTDGRWDVQSLYRAALGSGYAGAWDWALMDGTTDGNDSEHEVLAGVSALAGLPQINVNITSRIPLRDVCVEGDKD